MVLFIRVEMECGLLSVQDMLRETNFGDTHTNKELLLTVTRGGKANYLNNSILIACIKGTEV